MNHMARGSLLCTVCPIVPNFLPAAFTNSFNSRDLLSARIARLVTRRRRGSAKGRIVSQLRANKLKVILVVRQEQGWGQSAVTFVGVREFVVGRLANVYVEQILRELSEQAVSEPELGWIALRELLVRDLGSGAIGGGILPIQMRLVIQQLSSLPSLTVDAYRKAGSNLGLAIQHCREIVERVALNTTVDASIVKQVLGSLVSPEDPSKTRDLDYADLLSTVGSRIDSTALDKVLENLKSFELARERADESGKKRWRLDHDYLAMVVHELITEDNPSLRALQEASAHLRDFGAWKYFNKTPMSLKTICRIFWDESRGNVALVRYKSVVYISLLSKFGLMG
jgi:hypothetical protein